MSIVSQHVIQPGGRRSLLPRGRAGPYSGSYVAIWRHRGKHGSVGSYGLIRQDEELAGGSEDSLRFCGSGAVANFPDAVSFLSVSYLMNHGSREVSRK